MSTENLLQQMLAGDRRALARLMTLVENNHPDTALILSAAHQRDGEAYIIGITGPPGAGKSTLVDRLIGLLRAAGQSVGVVAIDPSSPFSGGAVLGDRIRMQSHYLDSGVFIRSMSTRGSHGGLSRATRHVSQLLRAFGKQFIIIETVGVGQTELDVMGIADTTIVVLVPEAGDTVQAMKAGLLEIADIFVINKADRDGAARIKADLEMMLQLRPAAEWTVPVLLTKASEAVGVAELLAAVNQHREFKQHCGIDPQVAEAARRDEFIDVLNAEISRRVKDGLTQGKLDDMLGRIRRGEIDPYRAALQVVADYSGLAALMRPAAALDSEP